MVCTSGCSGSQTLLLKTDIDTEVTRLNPDQGSAQNLGQTPYRLSDAKGNYVLRLSRPGYLNQIIIVAEAEAASGTFDLKMTKQSTESQPPAGLGRRLDLLSKAHRAFLRGHLEDARIIVQKLQSDGGSDFGTLILSGNIALAEGRGPEAAVYFSRAQAMNPEFKFGVTK